MKLSLAAYAYLDNKEFVDGFCKHCPRCKFQPRTIQPEQFCCPVDFDPSEPLCTRHALYQDIKTALLTIDSIWKEF